MRSTASGNDRHSQGAGDRDGRLLLDAVRLVTQALAESEAQASVPSEPGSPAPFTLNSDKVRCEAAMLLRAATPWSGHVPGLAPALACLGEDLEVAGLDDLAVRLCLHPGIALDLALVPLHLRTLGRGAPQLEPLLADLFGTGRLHGPERPANRELEQLWLHGLWCGEVEPGAVARLLTASSLAWEFDHLAGSTEDAYAFTHAILYATDAGRRSAVLPRPVAEIVDDAEAILAVALDAGNHDVAAEVLWTWPMLRRPWTPLASEARDFLADVSGANGFLPGPGFDLEAWRGLPADQRDRYVLRTSYHTTLVHGLFLAAAQDSGDPAEPGRPPVRRGVDAITELLPPPTTAASWWSWFARLSAARKEQLLPALLTMAVRRAARSADLAAVAQVVGIAGDYGIPGLPAVRQAGALWRRAMTCIELAPVRTGG